MSKHISMGGGCISQAVLLSALQASSLQWRMHPAQQFELISSALVSKEATLELRDLTDKEKVELSAKGTLDVTLFAVPIKTREDYPRGWIRLYAGDKLLYHIDNCAIPCVFGHADGWEAGNMSDIEKATLLWENTPFEDLPPGSVMKHLRMVEENDE